jgi:NAD(P)-dependent dehydrogenase (short-subunit alcohol dehydrogenase family)
MADSKTQSDHNSKVVVVTGAGSGIGRAVALAFLERGDKVALLGRRQSPLEETISQSSVSESAMALPTDVTSEENVVGAFAAVAENFGRVDLLFNNAGIFPKSASFEEIALADWEMAVDINLNGSFLCAREAFRHMKTQDPMGGRIINNGSISAHAPRPRSAGYTTTKHAINGLTKSIVLDGRPYNIACGQIDIGNAATQMLVGVATEALQANGTVMQEPTMSVDEVADAVLSMADLPLATNIQNLLIMATAMPYVGRG